MLKDLLGQMFGRLKVIEFDSLATNGEALWHCLCQCGKHTIVRGSLLRAGKTKSCGCLRVIRGSEGGYLLGKRRKA